LPGLTGVHPILLLILVIGVLLTVSWVKRLPPAARRKAGFKAALTAGALLLLFGLFTGRLNPVFVAMAAAIPILQRLMTAKSLFDRIRSSGHGPSKGRASSVSTRFLDMALDHDSGEMQGTVREGRFAGRELADLELEELLALLGECRAQDAQSAAVLEAYLDRHHGHAWRERHGTARQAGGGMTVKEACEILGVDESADANEIISAHRRLMQKIHPDRGGSHYLATKINQAKDLLLGEA
jgi:hypothetical protein